MSEANEQAERDIESGVVFARGMMRALHDYWDTMNITDPTVFYVAFTGAMAGGMVAHIGKEDTLSVMRSITSSVEEAKIDKKPDVPVGNA